MNLTNLEREALDESLKLGHSLRESIKLIECKAVMEYPNGFPFQHLEAAIPPDGIDSDGYVKEIWVVVPMDIREVEGGTHRIIEPMFHTSISDITCWIDRFELSEDQPCLLPSPLIKVCYWISSNAS